jgi:hypothetical protein
LPRRGDADETSDAILRVHDQVDVPIVECVAQSAGGVDGMLSQFAGIDFVTVAINGFAIAVRGNGQDEPRRLGCILRSTIRSDQIHFHGREATRGGPLAIIDNPWGPSGGSIKRWEKYGPAPTARR